MSDYDKDFNFVSVIKGISVSVIFSLVFILLFAFIIKTANLSSSVIKPVNQFIKCLSLFLGCFISLKGKRGLIKGAITGAFYSIIIHVIFALLSGEAFFNTSFLIDTAFCAVIGVIFGVLSVNLKRQS